MHGDLTTEIDAASDNGNEAKLTELSEECSIRLQKADGIERVHLHYHKANCHAGISAINNHDSDFQWSWEQPHGIKEVLELRSAILEPAFSDLDHISVSCIRTNLGNRLFSLGRPIAANEQWLAALESSPKFAKALANRGKGLFHYAWALYDYGHRSIILAAARSELDTALAEDAFWESSDREVFVPWLTSKRNEIAEYLEKVEYREDFDLDQWGFGKTQDERTYREWCASNRLFINPINDCHTVSVAARDVLHLPSHVYSSRETPRFPAYFNLLKQEFVSARYRLFRALHDDEPKFIMRDVTMIDTGEGQVLGHYTEEIRSTFRATYSIFDKIALFLNDYFNLGVEARQVNFTNVCKNGTNKKNTGLNENFTNYRNYPLRGLYFLSRDLLDLLDPDNKNVAEPDAANLAKLRHQAEHRFLSLRYFDHENGTPTHEFVGINSFIEKTKRMLKLAREALIYVSIAMHREEEIRAEAKNDDTKVVIPMPSRPFNKFDKII